MAGVVFDFLNVDTRVYLGIDIRGDMSNYTCGDLCGDICLVNYNISGVYLPKVVQRYVTHALSMRYQYASCTVCLHASVFQRLTSVLDLCSVHVVYSAYA